MNPATLFSLLLASLFLVSGCSTASDSNSGSEASNSGEETVVLNPGSDDSVTLSEKQTQWFVDAVSGEGLRSDLSNYKAEPIADFLYQGRTYLMHGNAVIHIEDDGTEYLWSSPYFQALISTSLSRRISISEATEIVEEMPNLKSIETGESGAYPGGGPAPLRKKSAD